MFETQEGTEAREKFCSLDLSRDHRPRWCSTNCPSPMNLPPNSAAFRPVIGATPGSLFRNQIVATGDIRFNQSIPAPLSPRPIAWSPSRQKEEAVVQRNQSPTFCDRQHVPNKRHVYTILAYRPHLRVWPACNNAASGTVSPSSREFPTPCCVQSSCDQREHPLSASHTPTRSLGPCFFFPALTDHNSTPPTSHISLTLPYHTHTRLPNPFPHHPEDKKTCFP